MAISINLFLRPAGIFSGRIPGIAIIFLYLIGTKYYIYFSIIVFCLQAIFICLQIPFVGFVKISKGIITSFSFSIITQLTIAPLAETQISDNLLLMAVGGNLLLGLGISLVLISGFRFVGTLGIAKIISERTGIPTGKSVLILESLLLLAGAFAIGLEQALVSVFGLYVLSQTINSVIHGMYQYKQMQIFSPENLQIRQALNAELTTPSTIVKAENNINGNMPDMLTLFIRCDQYKNVRDIILKYDKEAFVVVTDINKLQGNTLASTVISTLGIRC